MKRSELLQLANDHFGKQEYEEAMFNYSLVLQENPDDQEAKTGAILTEMAMNHEEGAEALYDYYMVLQASDSEIASEVMEEIINSMDGGIEKVTSILENIKSEEEIVFEDGISYEEFKELVADRGDFKRAFEDVMFSTKVLITSREDFIDFLENLAMHGFTEMALNYSETALQTFPNDEKIMEIFRLIGNPTRES